MRKMEFFETIVVGAGLIGSAVGYHLSRDQDHVAMIGPAEPDGDWRAHDGVFASHYDQGRITRGLDADRLWSELAKASIAQYETLEAESGISFYHRSGALQVGPTPIHQDDYLAKTEVVGHQNGIEFTRFSAEAYRSICPELHFADGYSVLSEPAGLMAGYVNPRELVAAQLHLAQKYGAQLVRDTVIEIRDLADGVEVVTRQGQRLKGRALVVAAGAWTHFLLPDQLGLTPTPRTILLARLDDDEAERLKDLPSIVFYAGMTNPNLTGVYMLPPIRYPDGHIYLKIGGKLSEVIAPQSANELNAWYHTEGSDLEADAIKQELLAIVPGLKASAWLRCPCSVTFTESKHPIIQKIEDRNIVVATGGCGAAAKSGYEIGRRAAQLLLR